MLRLVERCGRREFLRVGGLTLGGLALSQWEALRAQGAESPLLKDRAVVFLFLHGGPSQTETFDPKMTAPAGVRSVTGEVSTRLPGVTFGGSFPRLADLADQLAIVRSFQTGDGNHDIKPIVGRQTLGANLGSLYARIAGTNDPATGLPTNHLLFPRAVDESTMPGITQFGDFRATGPLGAPYAPFTPGEGGRLQDDMTLRIDRTRLDDRRSLLSGLDNLRRSFDADGRLAGADRMREQALATILGGAAQAFDLSQEDPRTIARYDTAPLVRPEQINQKWNNHKRYADNAKSLGKLLLLARRLCEHGAKFVTVTTNFVWDMHADANNATIEEGMDYMGPPLDWALSAFLADVRARGLSDKILLVATGEMGRTPKVNAKGGRDHWGDIAPLLLAGGGLPMGQVIGQSTADAGRPQTEPQKISNLVATILHALVDVGQLRLESGVPPELLRLATAAEPIPGLLA